MSQHLDPELVYFATKILELHGGLVEPQSENLLAILPPRLAEKLELKEEVSFGDAGEPLIYGHPNLEKLINLAKGEVPIVYGRLQVSYLKKDGFEQFLEQDFSFGKSQIRIINRAEARNTYMVLYCHFLALSDERKEGIFSFAIDEGTGALIPVIAERWLDYQPEFYPRAQIPPHFPSQLTKIIEIALKNLKNRATEELEEFRNNMQRHLQRDVRNTREYYQALKNEMEASLQKTHLTPESRQERREKIDALPDEMGRKITDLKQKYHIEVKLTACAAIRVLVPVVRLQLELRYRKLIRELKLTFNPISHCFDPLACENCTTTTREIHLCETGKGTKLLCLDCSSRVSG